jgi:hypothetical protein
MYGIQLQVDLTNIVLALIAVVALVAAWRQVKTMQSDSQTQIAIARQQELATRASVLLNLDERFGSQVMQDARSEMGSLIDRVIQKADQTWPALAIKVRRSKGIDFYPDELEKMRQATPPDPYIRLMKALAFFETVGYVTSSDYVPIEDILKLFGPAIKEASVVFEAHITKLRDVYQDSDLYNNFVWLINKSKDRGI